MTCNLFYGFVLKYYYSHFPLRHPVKTFVLSRLIFKFIFSNSAWRILISWIILSLLTRTTISSTKTIKQLATIRKYLYPKWKLLIRNLAWSCNPVSSQYWFLRDDNLMSSLYSSCLFFFLFCTSTSPFLVHRGLFSKYNQTFSTQSGKVKIHNNIIMNIRGHHYDNRNEIKGKLSLL